MAQWRLKLFKRYQSDHDNSVTWVGKDGEEISLTPLMVDHWCRAIVLG